MHVSRWYDVASSELAHAHNQIDFQVHESYSYSNNNLPAKWAMAYGL